MQQKLNLAGRLLLAASNAGALSPDARRASDRDAHAARGAKA